MKMSKIAAMLTVATVAFTGTAQAEALKLRLGTGTPPKHVWSQAAERFADKIAEATNGEIEVAVFPSAQLGTEGDLLQQMQVGVVDMGVISAAATSAKAPAFLAWFSPFKTSSVEDTIAASKTEVAGKILGELQPLGIKGMGYVFAGMRHILTAKDPVTGLDSLDSKKIRITPFPGMQVWWKAAGAVPTPVQLGDTYQALSTGLLDGVDIDLDALVGFSMQQVAEHLTVTSHMAFPGVAMVTEATWEKMTPEQQKTFRAVMDETLVWAGEQQIAAEERNMAKLKAEMTVTEMPNAAEAFSSANEAFNKAFGDIPLVAEFQATVGK
ncbi:TRAP transporter substrate-binding protein [Sneathiella chinensis]|uniref:C4-dicarboxylate ABC transporter substrate-binding protein n=1 Tax=Sneathiella chinensis TaxID=349750 RepID=A0ABQ5U3Y5_9PROT|nr:TRAP transporter substrate-binding protein [Sneathiella chinensis]GLQ06859.1 C4-dicarboxylate ABC transporter substrate-binding protein [Sneathiella chinensis]